MTIEHTLRDFIAQHPYQQYIIGYSGGVDSHVLLHAFVKNIKLPCIVVHVNHQLNPKATAWTMHCEQICQTLSVPLFVETINIDINPGDSLEEKARDARYAVFTKYLNENTALLTAHTLNDQAETFLFQALRGAGSKGLSAMPVKKKIGEGFLLRPLLTVSREQIEDYAAQHALQWIEDDSNQNTKFSRNFLRKMVFPLLKERFPKCMENFARSARLIAEQEQIIHDIIKKDLLDLKEKSDYTVTKNISVKALLTYPEPRQRLLIREWLREQNVRMPNEKHLRQILKDVIHAATDAHPVFHLNGVKIRRVRGFLSIH